MAAIQLNNIPKDIFEFILKTQGEIKIKKGVGQYSQEQTVLKIIEDLKKIKEKK